MELHNGAPLRPPVFRVLMRHSSASVGREIAGVVSGLDVVERIRTAGVLQAKVDADVAFDVAAEALLSTVAGLVLSPVLCDKGIDLSEAAGFVAVLNGPRAPVGHFRVQVGSSLIDLLEDVLGAGDEPCGAVESLLGLLAVAASGQAPVTAEFFERFCGGPLFPVGLGEVGGGALLVSLERGEFIEGRTGGTVHDRGQSAPFGPEFVDAASGEKMS